MSVLVYGDAISIASTMIGCMVFKGSKDTCYQAFGHLGPKTILHEAVCFVWALGVAFTFRRSGATVQRRLVG